MSLMTATNCKEGVFQYCNYGYDKTKYSSISDCMDKRIKECPQEELIVKKDLTTEKAKDFSYFKMLKDNKYYVGVALIIISAIVYKKYIIK